MSAVAASPMGAGFFSCGPNSLLERNLKTSVASCRELYL